jgi:thiaminase (transcriptional activator TenA)
MSDTFTTSLWEGITDIYRAILAHPFVTELTDGSLAVQSFAFYLAQDALFLRHYAQALAGLASRAPETTGTEMFARHAANIVATEMSLHDSLLPELGVDLSSVEEAPVTLAYTSYLLATVRGGSFAEGVGALLPCYWIYWEVGKHLQAAGSSDRRYQRWIDTYARPDYGEDVREVAAIADLLSPGLAPAEIARVRRHFGVTSRYEWMFWDMGYRREGWPLS